MALLTALAIGSAVVGVASAVTQHKQGKKAAAAQRTARAISGANEQVKNRHNRRRAAKETRLKQAQVLQSSENSGVSGSSGALGAVGSLQRTFAQASAFQSTNTLAAEGVSTQNQIASNAQTKANNAAGAASLFGAVSDFASSDTGQDIFGG